MMPQANINKGFDMILNPGDLKSPSVFRLLIFGLYRCCFFWQTSSLNPAIAQLHNLRTAVNAERITAINAD